MTTATAELDPIALDFKKAMRRLAATVTIVSTADVNGNRYGMTATAVNSLAMDPPSLLIELRHLHRQHADAEPCLDHGRQRIIGLHLHAAAPAPVQLGRRALDLKIQER